MTIIELLERHYRVHRLLAPSYEASIQNVVRNYERFRSADTKCPLVGRATVDDLSDERLNGLAAWMLAAGKSRATINKNIRTLIALANFARRHKISSYRPDVVKLPERRVNPEAWRPEEFSRILEGVQMVYGGTFWGRVLTAVLLVTYDTALRVIDSLAIESNSDAYERGIVYVTERKTGARRCFVLHPETLKALFAAFGAFKCGRVVQYKFKETNPLRRRLREVLKAVNLPTDRRQLFQKVRRTTATFAKAAGFNATEVLGHSAAWVTQTFYLDPDFAPPIDIANQLPRPHLKSVFPEAT